MRVLDVVYDPKTGTTTERYIDVPDVVSEADGMVVAQQQAQQAANADALRSQASDALANLRAYRDLASPTNAQTVAVVRLLCRVAIGLIRLRLERFDATD
jgi:hypothetical protein